MKKTKNYFCENCFENENIKQYIRENGKETKKEFHCSFCYYENEIDEFEVENCIEEYINESILEIEKNTTKEDFEENEDKYYEKCEIECREKYQKICEDRHSESIFIIEPEKLVLKLKKVVDKLYEHENQHGIYGSANSDHWTEGTDCPCSIAGLISSDEVCANIFDDDGEKIQNILEEYDEEFSDFHECPWLCKCFDSSGYKLYNWKAFCEHTKHKMRYFDHVNFKL